MSLVQAYNKAVEHLNPEEIDQACVEVGRQLAGAIDSQVGDIDRIASQFTRILVELKMTPKARQKVTSDEPSSKVDELRERRRARARQA